MTNLHPFAFGFGLSGLWGLGFGVQGFMYRVLVTWNPAALLFILIFLKAYRV